MIKTELAVLFKKMQRDDNKDTLTFEYTQKEEGTIFMLPLEIYENIGELVNLDIGGDEPTPVTAEFTKMNQDGDKIVLTFVLKGDSGERAIEFYRVAGHHVNLLIEPSQTSLEDYHYEDPHEGIEYSVDLSGSVEVKKDTDELE